MAYTAQPGGTLNVEGSFNQFFAANITARGLPDFMPSAVVNYDYPRQPLTYPSFSVTHFAAMPVQRFEGHQLDPGFKGAEFEGIAQIDCWESYQRASGNDKYNIRIMADMAQRVYATGAAIQILNIYAATANPSANGTVIRMNQAESMGLVPDPNPDITHWSLRVPYRWMARESDLTGVYYFINLEDNYKLILEP